MPDGTEFYARRHQKTSSVLVNRPIKFSSVSHQIPHRRQCFFPLPPILFHRMADKIALFLCCFQIIYYLCTNNEKEVMASDKAQYVVALIAEFAAHYGLSTVEAVRYFNRYKALDLFDRQYNYLHTQSFESNIRDISTYCRRMGGTL